MNPPNSQAVNSQSGSLVWTTVTPSTSLSDGKPDVTPSSTQNLSSPSGGFHLISTTAAESIKPKQPHIITISQNKVQRKTSPTLVLDVSSSHTSTSLIGASSLNQQAQQLPNIVKLSPQEMNQPMIKTTKTAFGRIQTDIAPRRSSTRSIKRKKFDDELVESSLIKTERPERTRVRIQPPMEKVEIITVPEKELPAPPPQPEPKKKIKNAKAATKRVKKQKVPPLAATKDLGRWKAQDDLQLILAVQQTSDLTAVHLGVKFSCKFTLKEIQERWYALLYDQSVSKLAVENIKQLHPDIIASIQAKALLSKTEENLLGSVSSASQPTLEVFQKLLDENPDNFHPARTAKALYCHWLLMKQYHLLPDQSVQPMPRGDHVLNFSDAEDMLEDGDLRDLRDEAIEHELTIADRKNKKEIRHLENEIPKWQVLVDSVTGISPADFDNQTLAVLRGRLVRYLMRSREITLGRATKDNQIDVDLSLEGPAWKISRRQGVIKLRNNGEFFIANEGKRPIYVDGKPILAANKQKLNNNSVVEISCLRFIFLINQDLINAIRQESQKMVVS